MAEQFEEFIDFKVVEEADTNGFLEWTEEYQPLSL